MNGREVAVEIIERVEDWQNRYAGWQSDRGANVNGDIGDAYPFVKNQHSPFTPARRALPMLNLALISSAGAYIDGTNPFDTAATAGDFTFREIPSEIDAEDLRFAARGYDPAAVMADSNSLLPLARLFEFESNGIIGQLNPVFWSFSGFIPDAGRLVDEMMPKILERIKRYEVQAALLIPASRLCHQSVSLVARAVELLGIPTMTLAVDREVVESVRPPRAALYAGKLGSVAGLPNWPEHQRRVLDEALRLIEPMDQAGIRRLTVALQSEVEEARGER
ncbi:MAG TPA: glycine/sarcosine/betaine reductase selenoprotein B family protein [Pyrinomonadaceae bacterium]|nr:glycine/sarcosine/betaine reductase selenoprotein B family protein [Pyrinomonadaceae bacterium]